MVTLAFKNIKQNSTNHEEYEFPKNILIRMMKILVSRIILIISLASKTERTDLQEWKHEAKRHTSQTCCCR